MKNFLIIVLGKLITSISKKLNLGEGSTWPGHLALKSNPSFIKNIVKKSKTKIVLIAGTNGKTTTGKLITAILKENNSKVIHNDSGANLLNGIASSLLKNVDNNGKINADYAIFEIDENTLPSAIVNTNPHFVICLNLFRDQLDRYGEVDAIAKKWKNSFSKLNNSTIFIMNADDPLIANIASGIQKKIYYFGLENKQLVIKEEQNAADSIYCPNCQNKLEYEDVYFAHLGNWKCYHCESRRPKLDISEYKYYPLFGTYNIYNTLASVMFATLNNIPLDRITQAFKKFKPAFGRQEKINYKNTDFYLYLSKNPTSFNESLRTVNNLNSTVLLLILNDRIPDGRDISWIYDIDFEKLLKKNQKIIISGDRAYEMALRIKYADIIKDYLVFDDLNDAVNYIIKKYQFQSTNIYALPTYSAMLELRKILTGKKIL